MRYFTNFIFTLLFVTLLPLLCASCGDSDEQQLAKMKKIACPRNVKCGIDIEACEAEIDTIGLNLNQYCSNTERAKVFDCAGRHFKTMCQHSQENFEKCAKEVVSDSCYQNAVTLSKNSNP